MTVSLDAARYHDDFDDAPLISTGSLIDDVALMADWFAGARDELFQGNLGSFMDADKPLDDLRVAAAMLAMIYPQLREQGFEPPGIHYLEAPVQFLEANAEYLASIGPFIIEPIETVH